MAIARSKLLDPTKPIWIHCTSRCVRRAFLCGDGADHRRDWIVDRLRILGGCFAVEVASYAVMANPLHVIVRMDRSVTASWSAEEVARRWLTIYPSAYHPDGTPHAPEVELIRRRAEDWGWIAVRRQRLADLGWYMKRSRRASPSGLIAKMTAEAPSGKSGTGRFRCSISRR